jgi:hypothetical protein
MGSVQLLTSVFGVPLTLFERGPPVRICQAAFDCLCNVRTFTKTHMPTLLLFSRRRRVKRSGFDGTFFSLLLDGDVACRSGSSVGWDTRDGRHRLGDLHCEQFRNRSGSNA